MANSNSEEKNTKEKEKKRVEKKQENKELLHNSKKLIKVFGTKEDKKRFLNRDLDDCER